jgi:hypothetical protein
MIFMSFGKHRGEPLAKVPFDYLAWCLRACERLDPWMRRAIEVELERRVGTGPAGGSQLADVKSLVSRWHRELSLKFHPDRGGSHEAMKAVNFARDRLLELLETS